MGDRYQEVSKLHKDNPNDKEIIDRLLESPELPNQPEIHIHIVIPNEFSPLAKYNIGITAGLETTVCPPQWIEGMNKMNLKGNRKHIFFQNVLK